MNMHRRTLSLLGTPAVVGALTIAVPALAGTGTSPTAHQARARHCSAVIVISHGRRVRACLIQGPRGYTGFPGATGKNRCDRRYRQNRCDRRDWQNRGHGATGKEGKEGLEGFEGAPGTIVAYAIVQPTNSPPTANLINPSNIAVSRSQAPASTASPPHPASLSRLVSRQSHPRSATAPSRHPV